MMRGDDENETNEDNKTPKIVFNASSLPSADDPLLREDDDFDVNDDGENTEDETEEEKRVELERRNASSITINATITTKGDDYEEEETKTTKSTSKKREEEKDVVVQKNETGKEDDEMMMMVMQRQNAEGKGMNTNEEEEEEDPDFYRKQVEKTKVEVVSNVGNILREYEKQSADVRKALEFTRKRGFGGASSTKRGRKRSLEEVTEEEEDEDDTDSDADVDEEILLLKEMLATKMRGRKSNAANTTSNTPFNIPTSEEITRAVEARLGEMNGAGGNAENKWAFTASAAAATEIFAAKKMQKAKAAFENANRKAKIAAEKLQRAEKLLRVASVLETRQKPNGEELKVSKIGVREQRRALKQKMRKEFFFEANRNGQRDNGTDTASSSEEEDEDEDEKDLLQSNVTAAEGEVDADMQDETKKKKNKKKNIPPHQLRDTKKIKEAPEPASEYIQKVVWSSADACHVCNEQLMDYWDVNDQILLCDGCDVQVHKSCYGIQKIPDGEWLCAGCEDGVSNLIENGRGMCALCPTPKGALARIKPKSKFSTNWRAPGYHAHVVCALTLPEISFSKAVDNDKKALESGSSVLRIDASKLTSSRMTLKCEICEEEGACTQCAMKKCYKAFHPLCARGSKNAWLRRAGTGQPMVFCSTHSSERWLQKRRETCSLPIESALNDAYLTGGSVFWGMQNAAVSQSTQLFANANGATTTTETTTVLANGRHEKALVNTGDGSMRVLTSINAASHSADDQLQQENKVTSARQKPVKVFIEKPKKGKRANLENITKGTSENIVPNAKSAIGRAIITLRSLNPKCMVLFPQAFVDENVKSDASIDSVCSVLKRTFSAFEVPGSQKYSEPWKVLTVAQRVIARDIVSRHKFLGLAFAVLRLPSGFGKRLTTITAMAIQAENPHIIVCDSRFDALNWIADLVKFCPKLRQVSILNANDAKNSLKGAGIQKSSFDVLVITTEIMFNVVLKHGTALNADGTPVPATYAALSPGTLLRPFSSANFDGVDGFRKWVAHFDDAASKIRLKTKRVLLMPNDEDKFENKGEEFRKVFRTVHARCGEVYAKASATSVWALKPQPPNFEERDILFTTKLPSPEAEPKIDDVTDTKAREMLTTHFEEDSFLQNKLVEPSHVLEQWEPAVNNTTESELNIADRLKESFYDMEPQKISNGTQGALKFAQVIASRSIARTLFVYDDKNKKSTDFSIADFAEKDGFSILDPLVKPFGARLVDAVEYRDIKKRTVGIVSLSGLKKASRLTRGTQVCVLYEINAQVVRDVVYPKLAPCDTRAKQEIPLVHLRSTSNVDEAAVKTLEDTEEAMAEFAKSVVSECSPEVQFLSSASVVVDNDNDATARFNRPTSDASTPFPTENHDVFCFGCKSSKGGGCKALPPAWLTPEVASIWLQCSKCPHAGSAGCARVLTAPNPAEPWLCPSHKCAVCGDLCGYTEKTTLRCVECGFAYCDTCSSGAEFEKAHKNEWVEKYGFVLPSHSEYVKCGVCCAAAKAPTAVVKKRKSNANAAASTLVL